METGPLGCGFLRPGELDALLERRLPEARRTAFARHLAEGCPSCALLEADLEVFRQIGDRGPVARERREFETSRRPTLARLRQAAATTPMSSPGTARPRPSRIWAVGLAAAALLVAALLLWPWLAPTGDPPRIALPDGRLLAVEAMPFSPPPVLRGAAATDDLWQRAGKAYEAGRFRRAALHFRDLETRKPTSGDASLYLGISLLMDGESAAARLALARAREKATAQELPRAAILWYEALAALAAGERTAAERSLAAAASEEGRFGRRAASLLVTLTGREDTVPRPR
jgi:hypothetical protein